MSSAVSLFAMSRNVFFASAALVGVTGCSKSSTSPENMDSAAVSPVAPASAVEAGVTAAASPDGGGYAAVPPTMASAINPRLDIPSRLAIEAGNRAATSKPTVEDVLNAINSKSGAAFTAPQQFMARTFNARYCAGETSVVGGVALSVCEYASEAEATKGHDDNVELLKMVKNRNVWRNKTTTLAIIEPKPSPVNDALEKKVVAIFQAM
jgi:hypothetical protein